MNNQSSNFHSIYHISEDGVIINTLKNKKVKVSKQKNGYHNFHFTTEDGKYKTYYIHKAIAEIYLSNPKNLPKVGFKDNDKTNYKLENLFWGTMKDIQQNANKNNMWSSHGKTPRKIKQIDIKTGNTIKVWDSTKEAAKHLGVDVRNINHALTGHYKTSGGFKWKVIKV